METKCVEPHNEHTHNTFIVQIEYKCSVYIISSSYRIIDIVCVCLHPVYMLWLQNCQLINWQHRLALMQVSISCQKHLHEINSRWRSVSPISLRQGCYKDHLHDRWDGDMSTCRDHAWRLDCCCCTTWSHVLILNWEDFKWKFLVLFDTFGF